MAALEREVWPLVKRWRVQERMHDGRTFRFFENGDTVLICGGIGSEAARRAAVLEDKHIDAIRVTEAAWVLSLAAGC